MKDRGFWRGLAIGVISTLVCLLFTVTVTEITGAIEWRALIQWRSNSIMTASTNRKLAEIRSYIDTYFLDEIDQARMEESICQGMVAGLGDTYAAYYNTEDYMEMVEKTSGNYCGIGAYVSQDATTGAITIIQPIEGGPAQEAGIKTGDVIYAIDGASVDGMDLSSVVSKMKGEPGTEVKLSVLRAEQSRPLHFLLTRAQIHTPTVSSGLLQGDIGYISVSSFEDVTKEQFRNALDELEAQGQKALIIDLRDNGGGLLATAVDMLDRLLPQGLVVYTQDKKGRKQEYFSTDDESFDKPIAILVNENSASASEVFAGAMQDYGSAVLVGTTTFGKGIVQSVFNLSDSTALKLTTSKYYTPKGRNIHGTGLEPDIPAELDGQSAPQRQGDILIDAQVKRAVRYLKNGDTNEDR